MPMHDQTPALPPPPAPPQDTPRAARWFHAKWYHGHTTAQPPLIGEWEVTVFTHRGKYHRPLRHGCERQWERYHADPAHYPMPHCHSPDGFSWGYAGSGPAELARWLLVDALHSPLPQNRPDLYQDFKRDVVASLPTERDWTLTIEEVLHWVLRWAKAPSHPDPAMAPDPAIAHRDPAMAHRATIQLLTETSIAQHLQHLRQPQTP